MRMAKTILCAGSFRSGSTWQYNILRIAHSISGMRTHSAWISDYDPSSPESVHIVKIHDPDSAKLLPWGRVVTSYRDLRHVVLSAQRMGWLGQSNAEIIGYLDNYLERLLFREAQCCYSLRYERIHLDAEAVIAEMTSSVGLNLTQRTFQQIINRVSSLQIPVSDYDRMTLLHPNHIASPTFSQALGTETIHCINQRYADWFSCRGYPPF
jgi:hypothetical protein